MSVHVESWVTVPNHTPWTISLLSEVPDADNLQPTDVFGDGFQDDDVWRDARMPQVMDGSQKILVDPGKIRSVFECEPGKNPKNSTL